MPRSIRYPQHPKIVNRWFGFILVAIVISVIYVGAPYASAKMELTVQKKLQFKQEPIALVSSRDGKYLYILVEGKLIVYSLRSGKVQYTVPVDKTIDKITLSDTNEFLILGSSAEKTAQILRINFIHQIEITGRPYRGPENAPVTLVAFMDYQ